MGLVRQVDLRIKVWLEANPHHYVEMAEFGLLQESDGGESSTSGWGAVSNLDQFFSTMYSYYYSKGLPTMCVTGVTNLLPLGFTIVLSTCLFALVDYAALLECRDESSCHALGDYVTREMLSRYPVRGALARSGTRYAPSCAPSPAPGAAPRPSFRMV